MTLDQNHDTMRNLFCEKETSKIYQNEGIKQTQTFSSIDIEFARMALVEHHGTPLDL